MKKHGIVAGCIVLSMILAPMAMAQDLPEYFVSFRLVENVVSGADDYVGFIFDGRYFITDRFDLGLSYQLGDAQELEMPPEIGGLSSSGEITEDAYRKVFSVYTLFHPFGRDRRIDVYVGGSANAQLMKIESMTDENYDIVVDTPPALGIMAKAGANWFFHSNIGLTVDAEAGKVFHEYSAEDRVSGLSADLDSPDTVVVFSVGVCFQF